MLQLKLCLSGNCFKFPFAAVALMVLWLAKKLLMQISSCAFDICGTTLNLTKLTEG